MYVSLATPYMSQKTTSSSASLRLLSVLSLSNYIYRHGAKYFFSCSVHEHNFEVLILISHFPHQACRSRNTSQMGNLAWLVTISFHDALWDTLSQRYNNLTIHSDDTMKWYVSDFGYGLRSSSDGSQQPLWSHLATC